MKKLLMASAVLFLFSASIMMFQISCSKTANAGTGGSAASGNNVIWIQNEIGQNITFRTMNVNDGTFKDINMTLPSQFDQTAEKFLACNGNLIIFAAFKSGSSGSQKICTCDMNGSNIKVYNNFSDDYSDLFTLY
jgi:hypothetical protein